MRRIVTNSDTEQTVEGSSGVAKAGLTLVSWEQLGCS